MGAIRMKTKAEQLRPAAIFKSFVLGNENKDDTPIVAATSYRYRNDVNKVALYLGYHEVDKFFDLLKACGKSSFQGERPDLL